VEPVTHALTSLALARGAEHRLPRFGTALVLVSGVAADLDYLSYFGGAGAFLKFHRAALHSLAGSAALVVVVTVVFCSLEKSFPAKESSARLGFAAALFFCCLSAAWHLLLDLCSGEAVQLFWPFRLRSSGWNLAADFDVWILVLFLAGLLLPILFRLVGQEIGARKSDSVGFAAQLLIGILLVYLGARGFLHDRAVDLLRARQYHDEAPRAAAAFPGSLSPFEWRGVVSTADAIVELPLSVAPGAIFDPDRGVAHRKPESSPSLDAAESLPIAKTYLEYARFPLASVSPLDDGTRIELRDLQFPPEDTNPPNILLRMDFDSHAKLKNAEFRFAAPRRR